MRGLSEANGSWKMIWISRRASRSASPSSANRSCPSSTRLAARSRAWPRSSCTIALPVVVLPQPDSPTSASVSPGAIVNDTPSTATKLPRTRCSRPLRIGKRTLRCSHLEQRSRPCAAAAVRRRRGSAARVGSARLRPATAALRSASRVAAGSARCAVAESSISAGGAVAAARRSARSQRGAKRQPSNVCHSGGTVPAIAASVPPRLPASGSACSSSRAYGCSGRAKNSSASAHLDDLAGVHQRHAVRHAGDDREVVRDQQHRPCPARAAAP